MIRIFLLSVFCLVSASSARADIVDDIGRDNFRMLYRYSCNRTFLTGSGISQESVVCKDGMILGYLSTKYSYFLFQGLTNLETNFNERGTSQYYPGSVCGLQVLRTACDAQNERLFALSRASIAPFNVALTLTSAPEPTGRQSFYGYAALPDANGDCAEGLIKFRPYQAVPGEFQEEPSNFSNLNGSLTDTTLSTELMPPNPMLLVHQYGYSPCLNGNCPPPSGGVHTAGTYNYQALSPVLCAVPAERFDTP